MGNTMAYSKCYNKKCNNVFEQTKKTCPFSDTCPNFMAIGFSSAKKNTNFDHIKEMSVDEFAEMFAPSGCPEDTSIDNCGTYLSCKKCWINWLESEYHN